MVMQVTDIDTFRTQFTRDLPYIDQTLKRFAKARLKRLSAVIYTNDDRCFRVTLSKAMETEIRSLVEAYCGRKLMARVAEFILAYATLLHTRYLDIPDRHHGRNRMWSLFLSVTV
jgi:hypothetical protein